MAWRLIERAEDLEPLLERWDALALAAGQPLAAPGWLLPWWRHAAPAEAEMRVVVLEEGEELVGIAPLFAERGRLGRCDYRLLGAPLTQRREPLAAPGREAELARAVGEALVDATPLPSLIALEALEQRSTWPELLVAGYPGPLRPKLVRGIVQSAPVVTLRQPDFDRWLEERSSNFRQQLRRAKRQLESGGGRLRLADPSSLGRDVDSFLELHHARWAERGGSGLPERMRELVLDAAEMLGERLRLWMVDLDGRTIGAGLFVAAGGEIAYVNGGFDEEQARLRPPLLAIAAALADGFERGERRLDLGGGANPYKQRFADDDDPLAWLSLRIRNRRYPITWAQLLPADLRWRARQAAGRLPEARREQLKALLRRSRPGDEGPSD